MSTLTMTHRPLRAWAFLLFTLLLAGPLSAQAGSQERSAEARLAEAIDAGDDSAAVALLSAGADPHVAAAGMAPFYRSARQGRLAIARMLVEEGAAFDERDPVRGTTPLDAAVYFGHAAFAQWLVELGAQPEETGPIGFAAFDWALEAERPEMVELVLGWLEASGAPSGAEGGDGERGGVERERVALRLIRSVLHDDSAGLARRLEAGDDPNAYSRTGYGALSLAARWGRTEHVFLLVDAGADPDAGDVTLDQASPLSQAARGGHTEIGRQLIHRGANVNKRNGRGMTALFLATLYARADFIRMLLDAGADPYVRARDENLGIDDYAAFDYAVEQSPAMIPVLLRWKIENPGPDDDAGSLRLSLAAAEGDTSDVGTLLDSGIGTDRLVGFGYSPLALAARNGHERVVARLLAAGADPNARTRSRADTSPLMEAVRDGHVEIARILLEVGARVNDRDRYGDTALNRAVAAGQIAVVRLLMEHGAGTATRGEMNETAIETARRLRNGEMISLLGAYREGG